MRHAPNSPLSQHGHGTMGMLGGACQKKTYWIEHISHGMGYYTCNRRRQQQTPCSIQPPYPMAWDIISVTQYIHKWADAH